MMAASPTLNCRTEVINIVKSLIPTICLVYPFTMTQKGMINTKLDNKDMFMSLLSSFVLIIPFCVIVNGYTKQIVGISDLTMFITSVLQLRVGLAAIIYSYGDMLGASYAIQPYRQLVDHPGAHPADYPSLPAHSPIRLRLNQLHFQYRDANTAALNKINL